MIEQLATLNASQGFNTEATNNPLSANASDIRKFDMAVHDQKTENTTLLDVGSISKANDGFLQIQQPKESGFIIKMDQEYKVILDKLREQPSFDKHWNVNKSFKTPPQFRSNIVQTEKPNLEKSLDGLLDDFKDSHKITEGIMKDIRQWSLRTQIWSSNLHVFTSIVSQTTSGFKALFHSSG